MTAACGRADPAAKIARMWIPLLLALTRVAGSPDASATGVGTKSFAVAWERFWFDREPAVDTGGVGTPIEG